jgi:hypothetical protein
MMTAFLLQETNNEKLALTRFQTHSLGQVTPDQYIEHFLENHLFEHSKILAPSHKAKLNQKRLEDNLPGFFSQSD